MGKTKNTRYFNQQDEDENIKVDSKRKTKNNVVVVVKTKLKPAKWVQKRNIEKLKSIGHKKPNPQPKYPGKAPLKKTVEKKYNVGPGVDAKGVRLNINKYKQKQKEKAIEFSSDQAARAEILLTESTGLLEADPGETTTQFRQTQILENVDITAATKHFNLTLNDFGPYRMKFTRNGRHLLLGGRKGHVAAFDWVTKKLHCEFNVMESVHDVCWLHMESMFAVAQKNWLYIYDNQGIELHCLKRLNKISRMEFLPYHFLLAATSEEGFLSWLDVSIGQLVSQYNSRLGRLTMMCQNPWNAIICTGHAKGVVSMWSPTVREPLAKMLCHQTAMTSLHIDPHGIYMATSATDRSIKIWDIRKLNGPVQSYRTRASANDLAFSEKSILGVAMGNVVEVYKDCCTNTAKKAYLRHVMNTPVSNMMFCPYEDVLGIATSRGYTSLIVPGSGEANFDALEANPFQTKKQKREAEVKSLLEKIQPEFITLDPNVIAELDLPTLQDKLEAKTKLLYIKPPKVDLTSRKNKNRSSVQNTKSKKIIKEQAKRDFVRNVKNIEYTETKHKSNNVLDRFVTKTKK